MGRICLPATGQYMDRTEYSWAITCNSYSENDTEKNFYLSNKYFFVDSFDPLMHHFNFTVYMSASVKAKVDLKVGHIV